MNGAAKKFVFYVITLSIPLLAIALPFAGYLAYKKLTFSYNYCGSYGAFDDELGWRLKENASSCLSLTNRLKGAVYFDSTIYTNSGGFRDARTGGDVPRRAVMTIGDSWTFGYGVNYEDSFPYYLSKALNAPVINAGIPGYGSGGNLLLFARNAEKYRPAVVVYHTLGLHGRSLCSDREAATTLTPCFYYDAAREQIELATPKPGAVAKAVSRNVYPGGSLTAGYDSLVRYMLWVRIPEAINDIGAAFGRLTKGGSQSDAGFDEKHLQAVFQFELRQYQELSRKFGFAFALSDPMGHYQHAAAALPGQFANGFVYVDKGTWNDRVAKAVASLPENQAYVPMDGHYGPGQNKIIGDFLAALVRERLPNALNNKEN